MTESAAASPIFSLSTAQLPSMFTGLLRYGSTMAEFFLHAAIAAASDG